MFPVVAFYIWVCFMFGVWYFRPVYDPDQYHMGSDPWMGAWLATAASAFFFTPLFWPYLVVNAIAKHRKKKQEEVERLRIDAERRSRDWARQGNK